MGLERWLRDRARQAVDWPFCSSSPRVRRYGDLASGWVIHNHPLPRVIYCAGVGLDMTFELELAKIAVRPVVVLDPTPDGICTFQRNDASNLEFFPVGLAAKAGVYEFSLQTSHPGQCSISSPEDGSAKVSFECWTLETIMRRKGDEFVDLLKMDIEGFEYDIVDQFLDQGIPVRQLCVEFHPWLRPRRTLKTIAKLYRSGYRIIHKRRGDHTFLMKESRFREVVRKHTTGAKAQ